MKHFRLVFGLVLTLFALALVGCGGNGPQYHLPHSLSHSTAQCPNGVTFKPCGPHEKGFGLSGPKPGSKYGHILFGGTTQTVEMFDSIESNVPGNAQAVAGYTGGSWPTYNGFVRQFPKLAAVHRVISIDVAGQTVADCIDREPGDVSASGAAGWVRWMQSKGRQACVYASVSNMPEVDSALRSAGVNPTSVKHWCAWYRYHAGLVSGCDAVQWTDTANGQNLDESTVATSFFPGPPPAPRLICFGHGAQIHNATCVRIRTEVGTWNHERDQARALYVKRGCRPLRAAIRAYRNHPSSKQKAAYLKALHSYHVNQCNAPAARVDTLQAQITRTQKAYS